jgi:ketosteroid isomerase-like protein
MSRENVESVRRSHEAFSRGDYEATLAPMADDVVWDDSWFAGGSVYRGWDGVRACTSSWLGTWDDYKLTIYEYVDVGDRVMVRGRQSGRARGSGIEMSMEHFQVWTFRDGEAIEIRLFDREEPALEAARVREEPSPPS